MQPIFFLLLQIFFLSFPVHCVVAIWPEAINLRPKESWWKNFQIKINFQPLFKSGWNLWDSVSKDRRLKEIYRWLNRRKGFKQEREEKNPIATRDSKCLPFHWNISFDLFSYFFASSATLCDKQPNWHRQRQPKWCEKETLETFGSSQMYESHANPYSFFNYLSIRRGDGEKKNQQTNGKIMTRSVKGWDAKIK